VSSLRTTAERAFPVKNSAKVHVVVKQQTSPAKQTPWTICVRVAAGQIVRCVSVVRCDAGYVGSLKHEPGYPRRYGAGYRHSRAHPWHRVVCDRRSV